MMNIQQFVKRVRAADELLIAMNMDGTVWSAEEASNLPRWLTGAERELRRLDRQPGVTLAALTERTYGKLVERTRRFRKLVRIAEHGGVVGLPGGGCMVEPAMPALQALRSLAAATDTGSVRFEGVMLDQGTTGVAIHSLDVHEKRRGSVLSALVDWSCRGRALGLKLVSGRFVLEARARKQSRAAALMQVLDTLPRSVLPVYAGSDPSDEPAIELVRERGGVGVWVGSIDRQVAPKSVNMVVPSAEVWVRTLQIIADIREERAVEAVAGRGDFRARVSEA